MACQVFGPNLRNDYVGPGFDGDHPHLDAAAMIELQCIAQAAYLWYYALTGDLNAALRMVSRRELHVLR